MKKLRKVMWRAMGWACNEKENAVIDSVKESVSVEEYEMVVCPTHKNDERIEGMCGT